jgi:hypothetical protein
VHDGDDRISYPGPQALVKPETGRVDQFVLKEDLNLGLLQTAFKQGIQVVQKAEGVRAPGQGDDFHPVTLIPEIPDQVAVINEAPGDGIQAAINEQTHIH